MLLIVAGILRLGRFAYQVGAARAGKEVIMGFASWMLAVLLGLGTTLAYEPQGRSSAHLSARWVGQDGHDYVGPHERLAASDIQDIHIAIAGLDPRREVVFLELRSTNGNFWRFAENPGGWRAEFKRAKGARTGDAYFEPAGVETGRPFHVLVRYDDGSTAETDFQGRSADPKLRVTNVALAARWIGQDRQDRTSAGPSVGPDGFQDVHIHLSRLATKLTLRGIRITGPGGLSWESGTNPKLLPSAELVRDSKDTTQADLFFQPTRDLSGQRLKLTALYENDQLDTTTVTAGRCDPKARISQPPLPSYSMLTATAHWLGQDAVGPGGPGAVHVSISGLPVSPAIAGAVLSNSQRGVWIYRAKEGTTAGADAFALPLSIKPRADRKSIDVFFPPYRDESKGTMTLRLIAADGRSRVVTFPGGSCDPGKRSAVPDAREATARPGDDLQNLVDQFGSVSLSPGTYRLSRPLVLNRPVALSASGVTTLLFSQPGNEAPWSSAIKIHCGNTTLAGFAVRFEGSIRWNNDVEYGPAVIGLTDNFDRGHDDPKCNVVLKHLDLEIPPAANPANWVESLRLLRLHNAKSGVVEANVLRGGMVEFFDGPWRIVDNDFRGTPPYTVSPAVFAGHGTHDIVIRGNKTRSDGPSGKTWRFLVFTWFSADDLVEGNTIEQVGARDDDTVPWSNQPEIILTEAYHLKYEGKVMALSKDGRVLRTGPSLGAPVATGDVVSLLNGPAAGQWRRIVQAIDSTAYLVDAAIPPMTDAVSISEGFVGQTYQGNRIDVRGGRRSTPLVLAGNHFGARVIKNHFLGGEFAFSLLAFPTETPVMWGWSHTPYLGGVIEGNILEDADKGGVLGVQHDGRFIKTNQGRVYMTVTLNDNVVRWSEAYLNSSARTNASQAPPALTLGYAPSHDARELIVTARGNRLEAPAGREVATPLLIHAADYNSQRLLNRRLSFSSGAGRAPGAAREARNNAPSRPR
jgi:hypothetical protein